MAELLGECVGLFGNLEVFELDEENYDSLSADEPYLSANEFRNLQQRRLANKPGLTILRTAETQDLGRLRDWEQGEGADIDAYNAAADDDEDNNDGAEGDEEGGDEEGGNEEGGGEEDGDKESEISEGAEREGLESESGGSAEEDETPA